jgi:2-polyprenyl-3-methyl-5-hydroxy-6-metoxy-1,4-benzoquinol methylase/glycosyltransferase involved in cell wall biosynthesis
MTGHILLLLATKNESGTIDSVLQEVSESFSTLERFGWTFELLIVNDGDDPEFPIMCEALCQRYELSFSIIEGPHEGLGAALVFGFEIALRNTDVQYVVNLDADGQHDARQLTDLIRGHVTTGSDITIGSRWTRGGRCYGLTYSRRVLSRVSGFCLHLVGVPRDVKDSTTSFRVYSRIAVAKLQRDLVGFNGFSFFGASIAIAAAQGLKVAEIPIHFRPRLSGVSNLHFKQILRAVSDLPSIRSTRHMVKARELGFLGASHGQDGADNYNARRELELLSNTPTSTRLILKQFDHLLGMNILEIGAGLGQISSMLVKNGRLITSLEPDPKLCKQLETSTHSLGVRSFPSTLEQALSLSQISCDEKFDSVVIVNVLEHIEDDIQELKIVKTVLNPDGKIIIFVPAMPSLYGSMDAISGHFRRYRRSELEAVVRAAGLETKSIHYFDPIGVLPYWLSYRVLNRQTLGTSSVALYDKVIIPMSIFLSRLIRSRGLGKNLIMIAGLESGINE